MRTLVTGGNGFIGSVVSRLLIDRGDEVLAVLRSATTCEQAKPFLAGATLVATPLDDADAMSKTIREFRPELLVHLAWYARPDDYLISTENVRSLCNTLGIIRAARDSGCEKIVAAGTCLEYARSDETRHETSATDPESLYASTKYAAWLTAHALCAQSGPELAWARIFHLYGPREDPRRLIPAVTASLRAGKPFALTPGAQLRDYLHVRDVARAIVSLTLQGPSGIFNVCAGEPLPLRETLLTLGELIGRPDLLLFGARNYSASDIMNLTGTADRLRATGWLPSFSTIREGLRDFVEKTP